MIEDTQTIGGCEAHAELVARALGPQASDRDLERYATEVVGCAACQRLLAVGAGVHPAHLEQVSAGEHEAIEARLVMDDAAVERLTAALQPRRRWPFAVLLAVAAVGLFWLAQGPPPAEVAIEAPLTTPIEVVQTGPELLPARSESLPRALPDAVAFVEPVPEQADWEPPPFEELRERATKQGMVREARLQLVGEPVVGDSVRLAVATATPEAVTVCVEGEERGVVWRGGLPAGRTVLTLQGRAVRYRFPAPGRYRFGLVLGEGCERPVHTVEVTL